MGEMQAERTAEYFDYLAEHFPVMCASDEFLFLPRAQAAARHYDKIDDLDADAIGECLADLKAFQTDFDRLAATSMDLETRIDLELLKANTAGILIEFEESRSWRHNPLLYLKIAFIGLDHALTKPSSEPRELIARTRARLQSIPRLLQQAKVNIESVPKSYHHAASTMLADCKSYLDEISKGTAGWESQHVTKELQQVESALEAFGKLLAAFPSLPDERFFAAGVEKNLHEHLLCTRSLPEIFQIAVEEWRENLEQIKKLQASIHPKKSWEQLYHAYGPQDFEDLDTFSLYGREIERLSFFFREHGFGDVVRLSPLVLRETPTYLRSVRSSASFSAASGAHGGEPDTFYLTTRLPGHRGKRAADRLGKRLHREYKFLTAHETIPGHQLLDGVRRNLKNPVRRQMESPLFYEGWAYYAESLLAEYGYVEEPIELLVDCKRRLWRAARCQVDVGLMTGMIVLEAAIGLLTAAGFSREEARNQVSRFRLNPGYQLCYSLGRYEIMELRKAFVPRLGPDRFHKQLLEGGELPFHLAAKRLRALDSSTVT
jgi:uncharacterized protein (DUF885 family)